MPDPAAVAETPAAPPAQPEPTAPTAEEWQAAISMERQRAAEAQQEARNARAVAEQALLAHRAPEPVREDPYGKLFEQGLVDPKAAGENLRAMISQEADRKAQATAQQMAAAMAQQQAQNNVAMMFNSFAARNPDLASPENQPRLAGAVVQADMEARRQGLALPQDQLLERAARNLRASNPRQSQPPAFVEGASSPSLSQGIGLPSNEAPKQSEFERMYGMEPGFIQGLPTPEEMTDLTTKYVNEENAEKLKFGIPLTSVRLKAS